MLPIDSASDGLKMEIIFKRRLTNELLTTYLPSLLLLLMSYATSYFKPFYFEAAVTVNLSILLVTTTLFIRWRKKTLLMDRTQHNLFLSVMEKLPATSYVRLVDIWLIFGQLYPFIQETSWFHVPLWWVLLICITRSSCSPLLNYSMMKMKSTIMEPPDL